MPDTFIDSHCHLNFECFDDNRESLINECKHLGVQHFIIPAVRQADWKRLITQYQKKQFSFTLGLHPYFVHEHSSADVIELECTVKQLVRDCIPQFVAIGEIGLDYSMPESTFKTQREYFSNQLIIAQSYKKPVILHHRKSLDAMVSILKQRSFEYGGVLHAFSGSYQQACRYIDMGFKIGVGGTITYPRAKKTIETIKRLPLNSLVLETDSPDMPISGEQGKMNTPANIPAIYKCLTRIRSEEPGDIALACFQNTQAAFNLPI